MSSVECCLGENYPPRDKSGSQNNTMWGGFGMQVAKTLTNPTTPCLKNNNTDVAHYNFNAH